MLHILTKSVLSCSSKTLATFLKRFATVNLPETLDFWRPWLAGVFIGVKADLCKKVALQGQDWPPLVYFFSFFLPLKSWCSFWRYFVLFRESCVRRTCMVFVSTFMMWPCTLMPFTVVVARSFPQHAGCFTPVSSQLSPGLCTWLRFRYASSQLWKSSWCSFGICYCTLTLSSIYSAQSRLLVVASMVYWIGSVGLYLRNPRLGEHWCLWSKPTCLSMNHLVSKSKDHLLSSSFSVLSCMAWTIIFAQVSQLTSAPTHLAMLFHSVCLTIGRSCLETPWKPIPSLPRLWLTQESARGSKKAFQL